MNTDSVDMVRVDTLYALRDGPPGSFCFRRVRNGDIVYRMLWLKLPSGGASAIAVCAPTDLKPAGQPVWEWDGNEDKPTLSPSVHQIGEWHGWIRDGRMVSC